MTIPYKPQMLPLNDLDFEYFVGKLNKPTAEIARYDGLLISILNPNMLLSILMTKEAVLSSKIEGTQATLEDVLAYDANQNNKDLPDKKLHDIQEIINYRQCMTFAIEWLKDNPITLNFIKQMHDILMDSVRGKNKKRGDFRTSQNWIGVPECSIEKATYIPPSPLDLKDALYNFERYINFNGKDILIQTAIMHAQFEIIHPFMDGNGRLGRLLIPLFLYKKGMIRTPSFYISGYFEKNRDEYYLRLREITEKNRWNEWIEFFLDALYNQAKENVEKARAIINLYNENKDKIRDITKSQYTINILDTIFKMPVFNTQEFIKTSKIPRSSVKFLLNKLEKAGVIRFIKKSKGRTPNSMFFEKLIDIIG